MFTYTFNVRIILAANEAAAWAKLGKELNTSHPRKHYILISSTDPKATLHTQSINE
jgi:hypothetical protein